MSNDGNNKPRAKPVIVVDDVEVRPNVENFQKLLNEAGKKKSKDQ